MKHSLHFACAATRGTKLLNEDKAPTETESSKIIGIDES